MKRSTKVAGALVAIAALLSAATPAYAYTPTLSEVRFIPGADPTNSWYGTAVTPDGKTIVALDGSAAWVVDVATNTSTAITPASGDATATVIDSTGRFAYIAGTPFGFSTSISKVDLQTKSIVNTWTDAALIEYPDIYISGDGATLYAVGVVGSYPNFEVGLSTIDTTTGAVATYTTGTTGQFESSTAVNDASGVLYLVWTSTSNSTSGIWKFDTTTHAFTSTAWTGSGQLRGCDYANSVMACFVEDTANYVVTLDSSGNAISTLTLDTTDTSPQTISMTPDGSAFYVFGQDSNSTGIVEEFLSSPLSRGLVFNLSIENSNSVAMAPLAGQLYFTADYFGDYGGGYQVVQYAEPPAPELPNTGVNSATVGVYFALSGLLLTAGAVTLLAVRRRHAQP